MVSVTVNGEAYSLERGRVLGYSEVAKLARRDSKYLTIMYVHESGIRGTLHRGGPKAMATDGLSFTVMFTVNM